MHRRAAGFSLIELLVVLVLLALASAAVVLSVPPADPLREPVQRLAARLAHAQDQAVLRNQGLRVLLDGDGYRFEHRQQGQWQPSSDPALAAQTWPAPTTLVFAGQASEQLQLTLDPAGNTLPGLLELHSGQQHWQLQLHADGSIDVQRR